MLPPTGIEVFGGQGRDQHRECPPRIAADHCQHRQLCSSADLAVSDRHHHIGKPEVALSDLAGHIRCPRRRIRAADTTGAAHGPGHSACGSNTTIRFARRSPSPASSDRPPAIPGSSARPHQPLTRWPTLILRRASRGQHRFHRVPRNPQYPRDLRNRQLLRPAQPPDLCPVLHAQHSLPPWLAQPRLSRKLVKIELPRSGQYSIAADTNYLSRLAGSAPSGCSGARCRMRSGIGLRAGTGRSAARGSAWGSAVWLQYPVGWNRSVEWVHRSRCA